MPIYEYLCDACGHEFEVIQKVSEGRLRKCPECSKSALKKKVSAGAFRLSGSESSSSSDGGNKSASSDAPAKTGDSKGAGATSADTKSKPDAAKSA